MSGPVRELVRVPLRAARAALAEFAAAVVERFTALEPWFVRTGRALSRRSRFGGGLYWFAQEALMRRLRQSGHCYREVTIQNLTVYVDVTDPTGRFSFFYSSLYEKAVVDAVITALRPGDVFIDIGAHLGYFSIVAARLVGPTGRVIAFEPHERSRDDLRAMAARNELQGIIEIVPLALAEREADFTLHTSPLTAAYSTLDPSLSPVQKFAMFRPSTVVHATTLDAWLSKRPELVGRVRCIKIDVQGTEWRVLAGMPRTLRPSGLAILCETTIGTKADAMLERAGYRRHRIERGMSPHANFLYVRPGPG